MAGENTGPESDPASADDVPSSESSKRGGFVVSAKQLVVIGLVLAVAVGASLGLFVFSGRGTVKRAAGNSGESEVFLEPVDSAGHHPFTPSVGTDVHLTTVSTTTSVPATTTTATAETAIPVVEGDSIGLYGGTRNAATCDPNQLVNFLEQNPAKGAAWARVVGIQPAQIRSYVATLTPVILRSDTRVTNHGFENGHATAIPAVLQAGTAVLVDQYGQPVTKCFCGNPLSAPVAETSPVYTGTPWPGFTPTNLTVINQATTIINVFTLFDPQTGRGFGRPAGTTGATDQNAPPGTVAPNGTLLGTGAVQITLAWTSTADLDLHVIDPTGTDIYYGHNSSPTGGQLDVDSNSACRNTTTSPVENVFWANGVPPSGQYRIRVDYYSACTGGAGPQSYTVIIRQNSHITDQRNGTINPGEVQDVAVLTK